MKINTKSIALTAMLSALAIVFSFLEGLLPPLPFMPPGAKIGLSNIVTMFAAGVLGLPVAVVIAIVKAVFSFLMRGVTAGALSLAGGLLSTVVMWLVFKVLKGSYIMSGVCGALSHNFAQLLAAYFITSTTVVYYVPFLVVAGVLTGILSGTILKYAMPPLIKIKDKLL